jgi:DNA-binding GntR family transcriptional regulator
MVTYKIDWRGKVASVIEVAAIGATEFAIPESIASQLARQLRERIVRLEIKPGQILSETEIAKAYAVSRQPAREAFIKLAEAGLVEVRPQRGTYVTKILVRDVMDGRFVREAIEADVVRAVASAVDQALIADLRGQIAAQRRIRDGDNAGFLALDEAFHHSLAKAAGKSYAWRVVETIKAQMDRVRYLSFGASPFSLLIDQHQRIVDALESGDADAAEAAMRAHLRELLRTLPEVAAAHPDLFDMNH